MTLRAVLDGIGTHGKKNAVHHVAHTISGMIVDELRYRRFKEQAPGLFEYKLKNFHTSSYAHMARSLNASLSFAGVDVADLDLDIRTRLLVGTKLIDVLIEATGLVEIEHGVTRNNPKKRTACLVPTPETEKWLADRNSSLELTRPLQMPMVVPPLRWEPKQRGGYRFALRNKHPMVRRVSKRQAEDINQREMPTVYEALNCLQNTAWRINPNVYGIVNVILERGGGVAGIPETNPLPLPAKPQDIETNEQARRQWRHVAGIVKEQDHMRRETSLEVSRLVSAAQSMAGEPAIFFPYSLDFRGRVYPLVSYLSPQGNDLSRSLLLFADGKEMDAAAVKWLAVHGANCMDTTPEGAKVSRMTLDERCEWVIKNSARIMDAADRPFDDLWWATAEKPLQFYAFCVEWANLIRANDRGERYVCALPCSMDGSCNGLQHLSALLCDSVGGAAVNVAPQDRPQDVYQRVADLVLSKLELFAATGDRLAGLWLSYHQQTGIVNRKLCKRPTMTFVYGSKRFGFKNQLKEYIRGLDDWRLVREHFTALDEEGKEKKVLGAALGLMSGFIWDALRELVVAAFHGMAWMQKAARGVASQNKTVEWTVEATGFKVRQDYYKVTRKQVQTLLAGSAFRHSVWTETPDVNPIKQANAVAPNIVHSLDAAVLMMTVVEAAAEGVEQFAMVHDSYGTVPSDCALLARVLRQVFAKFYSQRDVADDLYQQFRAQYQDEARCPVPPLKGDLQVSHVQASDYFFA